MPASPSPQPDQHARVARTCPERQSKGPQSRIYTLEAKGLLIVAVIILIITIARYWHSIAWSAH